MSVKTNKYNLKYDFNQIREELVQTVSLYTERTLQTFELLKLYSYN